MEITGRIAVIGTTEIVGAAQTFKKRLLVVETNEQYAQKLPIDFVQDKCSVLDKYNVGDNVTVGINLKGSEYNGRYYCNIQGWKIDKDNNSAPQAQAPVQQAPPVDLPF